MDYLHDKGQAAQFLNTLDPTAEKFLFVEIGVDGGTRPYYTNLDGVWPAIERANIAGGSNWFVTINETKGIERKVSDVIRVRAVFIDCDQSESVQSFKNWGRSALASSHPSIMLGSSSGKYHAYWLVSDCSREQFKPLQQGLIKKFGSDGVVCDLSRIMRLAGTYNVKPKYLEPTLCKAVYPNIKNWTVKELTEALELQLGTNNVSWKTTLEESKAAGGGAGANAALSAGTDMGWYNNLSASDKNRVVRTACKTLWDATKVFECEEDGGLNADWYRLSCAIARSGAPDAENIFVEFGLKAKNPDSEEKLREHFNRTDFQGTGSISVGTLLGWAQKAGADFGEFKTAAAVAGLKASGKLPEGVTEPIRPGTYTKEQAIVLLSEKLFVGPRGSIYHIEKQGDAIPTPDKNIATLYLNVRVDSGTNNGTRSAIDVWKAAQNRPTREVIFDPQQPPGVGGITNDPFNAWQGFACIKAPDPTKTKSIHDLISRVICNGNMEHYEYVLNCLAWLRQKTGKPLGVCLHLIGTGGMGKSVFGEHLVAKYFGEHGIVLNSRDQLDNKFNSRFSGKVLTFVEEIIFHGDRGLTDKFKTLVTTSVMEIERKGLEAQRVSNCNSFIMATNHDHAFHSDEGMRRRIFPLRISSDKTNLGGLALVAMGDIESGGREAFWDELAVRDISSFAPSRFPENAEIISQSRMSQGPVEDFLLAIASAGGIKMDQYSNNQSIPCNITPYDLYKAFVNHNKERTQGFNQSKLAAAIELKLGIKLVRPWNKEGKRERVYSMPNSRSIIAKIDPALLQQEDEEDEGNGPPVIELSTKREAGGAGTSLFG